MEWEPAAENVLAQLCLMVPETLRDLAAAAARDEAELVSSERSASAVTVGDALRGWIRVTPPEQRNGLVAVIEGLGHAPEEYADELESAEGWEDEDADPQEGAPA